MAVNRRCSPLIIGLWSLAALVPLVMMLVGGVTIAPAFVGLAILLVLVLLLSAAALGLALAICYRHAWRGWPTWVAVSGTAIIAGLLSQQPISLGPLSIQSAASLLFLGTVVALLTGATIALFRSDTGISVAGWVSLGAMWGLVIWWLLGGDFIVAMLAMLSNPSAPAPSIFWPTVLFNTAICLTPLALASFAWHTVRLVRRELRPAPLPPAPDASPTSQGAPNDHEHPVR